MSKLAQQQRNRARRQVQGQRRRPLSSSDFKVSVYTVKNTGTRKTLDLPATSPTHALELALARGLAKSLTKLVVA